MRHLPLRVLKNSKQATQKTTEEKHPRGLGASNTPQEGGRALRHKALLGHLQGQAQGTPVAPGA